MEKRKAVLSQAVGDNTWDMKNGCKVSLRYRRYGDQIQYSDYHDVLILTQGESVRNAIRDLHALADRLELHCITEVV